MVTLENVTKIYPSRNGVIEALRDISFAAEEGEFISVLGPSGCGKSTLLKLIGDVQEPTLGCVRVNGCTSHEVRLKGMFSFVFQNPVLLPWRTVLDNVRLPLEILHTQARDPTELLDLVGLRGFEKAYPRELSGGMQQRAALARALTYNPSVLLMDEPFGAVDELNRAVLNDELLRIWSEIKVTVFFITHSIVEAVYLADRVVLLSKRPATIKAVLPVEFPRPRTRALQETVPFQSMVHALREDLE